MAARVSPRFVGGQVDYGLELAGDEPVPALALPTVDSAPVLEDVKAFLKRFVAYPSEHGLLAHTLWIAHTHCMAAAQSTPRLAFLSPEPASGKTRALEITGLLVPNPVEAINVTPAYLFRKVADPAGLPTILFDEIDTVFGPRAKENEDIRGLLNAGHRRGAVAGRCVVKGKLIETEEIPAYCAVALAGLGSLPDTLLSRAVVVRMRRRAPNEAIEPFRRRDHEPLGTALRERLAEWAAETVPALSNAWPVMPEGVTDRDADVWEPLLAIADAAGGEWPTEARVTAVTFVTESKAGSPSLGLRLLSDLRDAFGDREGMFTTEILEELTSLEDAPWGDLRGRPLDARGLSQRLGQYQIKRSTFRLGSSLGKGYRRVDLVDAWERYLPKPPLPDVGPHGYESVTSVTPVTAPAGNANGSAAAVWCQSPGCIQAVYPGTICPICGEVTS